MIVARVASLVATRGVVLTIHAHQKTVLRGHFTVLAEVFASGGELELAVLQASK